MKQVQERRGRHSIWVLLWTTLVFDELLVGEEVAGIVCLYRNSTLISTLIKPASVGYRVLGSREGRQYLAGK